MRRLSVAALFAAIAGTLVACSSATGDGDEKPGRGEYIVYSVAPTILGDFQMFRIRPDGTQKLAMTDPVNRSNDEPAFDNAAGNTLVFSSSRDFGAAGTVFQRMLYKTTIDATIQSRVTANSPQHCYEHQGHFSADDKMITFTLTCDNAPAGLENIPLVHRINTDGSGQARVVSTDPALAVPHAEVFSAFAPSGRIVFAVNFGTPSPITVDLFAMDADGRNTQRLTNLLAEGRTIVDRITILGNSVYFVSVSINGLNNGQLEAINVDGTGRTVLYRIPDLAIPGGGSRPQDSQFAPSPDGHSMAFVRTVDATTGKTALFRASADGTSATAIDSSGFAATPAWK